MKINKLQLPFSITDGEGIKKIDISRLGSVVALVGRNGSGKSRILKLVEQSTHPNIGYYNVIDESISCLPVNIQNNFDLIFKNKLVKEYFELLEINKRLTVESKIDKSNIEIQIKLSKNSSKIQELQNNPIIRNGLVNHTSAASKLTTDIREAFVRSIRRINYEEIRSLQTKIDETANKGKITFEKLIESVAENEDYNEFSSIHRTALNYLSKLPHELVIDKDEAYGDSTKYEEKASFKRYFILKKLIKDFLNKNLEWEKEKTNRSLTAEGVTTESKGVWKLEGRPFNYLQLSDGEKTLFAYSLLFFLLELNPRIRIKESIIIIDEPELHLHPESELWLINGIRNVIKDRGQLWIATHSLSILSSLSHEEIFMVKNGELFSPDKSIPGRTLTELMGLDEHIDRLNLFISDISKWAYLNFMTQCFLEPDVVKNAQPNDPEVEVFFKTIAINGEACVLLDFGAGQGRVYKEIVANEKLKLNYFALEPDEGSRNDLRQINPMGIFADYTELPENKFDFVLICNVLHEIPVIGWDEILNKVAKSLNENGYLIIIEDLKLPKGEKIEKNGFIILDVESLDEVFNVKTKLKRVFPTAEKYKDRILCVPIQKNNIGEITKKSIENGLNVLKDNTYNSLKKLRENATKDKSELHSLGRLSAFYSQLYINTFFALDSLKEK